MTEPIRIDHERHYTLSDVTAVARGALVTLGRGTRGMIDANRNDVIGYIQDTSQPAYGFNRGFGSNVKEKVPADSLSALQENLIRSHACGVGDPSPIEVVRATMFLRAVSLARGHSGVRSKVVTALIDCLNKGVVPVVPIQGSVSASGDLAPLSHIALCLMGEGDACLVKQKGGTPRRVSAASALKQCGLTPLRLEMKEGLALNNGVQYSTALTVLATEGMVCLIKTAAIATALTAQVMLGADTPFRRDLHDLRRHKGSQTIADCILRLMEGSRIRELHRRYEIDGEIQDPYNLRCAAQILGPCLELIWRAKATVEIEINSVTDNPIVLRATNNSAIEHKDKYLDKVVEIVSAGHFHGMPIAVDCYGLLQAASIMARLSNMRSVRYVDGDRNKGLGAHLKWPGKIPPVDMSGVSDQARREIERRQSCQSAMMIPEYTSASLTNWLWGQSMPSHLFSLSTDSGQEDHVSMAANVAIRAFDALPRLSEILAIELAYAGQAAAIRKEMRAIPSRAPKGDQGNPGAIKEWHRVKQQDLELSKACQEVLNVVTGYFPPVTTDRVMAKEITRLGSAILEGKIVSASAKAGDFFRDV